jgi:NADH-quinone oxidoreductase subunit M
MNIILLLFIPLLTAVTILLARNQQQVKWIAFAGAAIQLLFAFVLLAAFRKERLQGNKAQMLFEQQYNWFPSWNISFHIGVDGISVAMILLTAFVVIAGVLVSWKIEKMTREFFFLLILLSLGAYGFFLSLDLFILFFSFYNLNLTREYLTLKNIASHF